MRIGRSLTFYTFLIISIHSYPYIPTSLHPPHSLLYYSYIIAYPELKYSYLEPKLYHTSEEIMLYHHTLRMNSPTISAPRKI